MRNTRIIYLINIMLVTLCCGQSAHADNHFDNYEQQLGQIQQQLNSLKTISYEIQQIKKQLDFQGERLSQMESDVGGNERRTYELNVELTSVRKQLGIQGDRLSQMEIDVGSYERGADELKANLTAVRNQLDSELAVLAKDMQNLDNKLSDKITHTNNKLEQNLEMAISNQEKLASIQDVAKHLESKLNTRASSIDLDQKISSVNQDVSSRTLYVAISIAVLIIVLLWFKRRLAIDNAALSGEMTRARDALDSEYNALDLKLSEILEKQINVASMSSLDSSPHEKGAPDHSLPLKVATEIHRMRKRIASMADDTKGIKPLAKALERLEESLAEQNYEVIDLLGQKYVEGMTVNLEFKLDEELEPGEKLITNVIKPQVNYNGVLIQVADIVVSTGE